MEKKDTGLGQITDKDSGQPIKKKLKLDRSALNSSLSKPTSNGVKPELKQHSFHDEKRKHDRVNSPLNSSIKKEVSPVIAISPAKIPSIKPPAPDDSDDDDVPLVARANAKLASHPHNQKVTHSVNSESMKSKSDHAKSSKESHKHSTSSGLEKKIKSDSASAGSVKVKVEGVKKVKSDSNLSLSSKVDGVKKLKSESGISKSPKISGDKKIKSESGELKPPKFDGANKVKSEGGSLKSPKVDGEKKVRSDGESLKSPQVDIERKIKSESGLLKSLKVDGEKKVKTSSGLMSPKLDGIQKIKTESDSSGSPKVEGEKKVKVKSDSQLSSKVEGVKKVKSEKTEGEKKLKAKSDKVDGVKKIKTENGSPVTVKTESVKNKFKSSTDDSDDDVPLAARVKVKKDPGSEKKLSSVTKSKERKRKTSEDDDDDDYKPLVKAKKKSDASEKRVKKEKTKDKKKEKDKTTEKEKEKSEAKPKKSEEEVWKWWEEEKHPEGIKWLTLEHKGPYFPPPYEPLPDDVNFYYDGKKVKLSEKSEEVAGFYAKMLEHDYTSKKIFNDNFFEDWRKEMSDEERRLIKDLSKCNFKEIHAYYDKKNEERKNMSKEEKQKLKENNEVILQEYGFCIMDGHKERVGNFKIEPPGLFRGRGDHPKQGKLKKRVRARDVTINIGKDSVVPSPPEGQKWKAISHDNKVTWLACWIENIQGSYKYVMLNPTSRIKGEKDWQKYETARKLKGKITKIRSDYTNDWKSKEMRLRQRGVALYFIDKLALRAGHEKDEDTADTVGCCSLRVEHIKLHRQMNDKEYVVEFDFLGKDSIHYHNLVEVEKRVFKNLELFKQGKTDGDDLFDRLSTTSLNKYLSELMEGLSAKVFRTYNASMTLQDQLNKLELEDNVAAKVLGYNRANRAVAILCNHQRSVPKSFEQSMTNLQQKIEDKRKAIKDAKKELKEAKAERKSSQTAASEKKYERKKSAVGRLQEQLFKLEVTQTDKEENKEIALGTSKLNYLDPRISIAWCRKNDVPIEKIYNKTQRQKFAWAIDMTEEDFEF